VADDHHEDENHRHHHGSGSFENDIGQHRQRLSRAPFLTSVAPQAGCITAFPKARLQ
jgi:hypothetical protein